MTIKEGNHKLYTLDNGMRVDVRDVMKRAGISKNAAYCRLKKSSDHEYVLSNKMNKGVQRDLLARRAYFEKKSVLNDEMFVLAMKTISVVKKSL